MPLALITIAALLIMTGINGNYQAVGKQFEQDVMGGGQGGGFVSFMVGIIGIATFFRVIGMPNAGKVFISLVIIVFLLKNANLLTAIENLAGGTATGAATAPGSAPAAPAQGK